VKNMWNATPKFRGARRCTDDGSRKEMMCNAVKGLVSEGALSKAFRRLEGAELVRPSGEELLEQMRQLHPVGRPCDHEMPRLTAPIDWDTTPQAETERLSILCSVILRTPPASGAGPSGLKPAYLKDVLGASSDAGSTLVPALLQLIRAAVMGTLHPSFLYWLSAAKLMALAKPGGGLRPIAVGETIRRVIS